MADETSTVLLEGEREAREQASLCDDQGQALFAFGGVEPGVYRLTVLRPGNEDEDAVVSQRVVVAAGERSLVEVDCTGSGTMVRGIVLPPEGLTTGELEAAVTPAAGGSARFGQAEGLRFEVSGIESSSSYVGLRFVEDRTFAWWLALVDTASDRDLGTIDLGGSCVRGVVDGGGAGNGSELIVLRRTDPPHLSTAFPTDANGSFQVWLAPGRYEVGLLADDRSVVSIVPFTAPAAGAVDVRVRRER
jgi:hypothetical protein